MQQGETTERKLSAQRLRDCHHTRAHALYMLSYNFQKMQLCCDRTVAPRPVLSWREKATGVKKGIFKWQDVQKLFFQRTYAFDPETGISLIGYILTWFHRMSYDKPLSFYAYPFIFDHTNFDHYCGLWWGIWGALHCIWPKYNSCLRFWKDNLRISI